MSEKNPIRIYVTHSFASHSDYHRVFEYLEAVPNFFYRNCSVPDHPPTTGGKESLKEEYRTQMKSVILWRLVLFPMRYPTPGSGQCSAEPKPRP